MLDVGRELWVSDGGWDCGVNGLSLVAEAPGVLLGIKLGPARHAWLKVGCPLSTSEGRLEGSSEGLVL